MSTPIHAIYGEPPRTLVPIPAEAQQFSPLIPGSARMKDFASGTVTSFTVHAPPGTLERRYVLARALTILSPGGTLTALARNDKGGSRIAKELEAFGCTVSEESRAHHRIVSTTRATTLNGLEDAIEAGGPQQREGLWTHPGVFSWDRTDPASTMLLQQLPSLSGAGADLGCGIGILSLGVLKSKAVTALTLVDIDRRAIAMAEKNITDIRARFLWSDMRDLVESGLDFVVMNPPFHDNGMEDRALGQLFITRAAAMLKPGGTLFLVANRHLPYESLLDQHFTSNGVLAADSLYKVMTATK